MSPFSFLCKYYFDFIIKLLIGDILFYFMKLFHGMSVISHYI